MQEATREEADVEVKKIHSQKEFVLKALTNKLKAWKEVSSQQYLS